MTTALTPSDIRTIARKAADYITFHCEGLSRGFEITHKGYIAFINYEAKMCNDERQDLVLVPAVWDAEGKEYPDISEAEAVRRAGYLPKGRYTIREWERDGDVLMFHPQTNREYEFTNE